MKIIDERATDTMDSWTVLPAFWLDQKYPTRKFREHAEVSFSLSPFI